MKFKLAFLSVFFFLSIFSTSSNFQDSKTEFLCGKKWFAKAIEMNDLKIPVPEQEQNEMWMIFHKDGVHEVNVNNKIKKGKWELSNKKDSLFFTTESGKKNSMKIINLTKTNLNVSFQDGEKEMKMFLEKKQ